MYACLRLSAVIFITHGLALDGWKIQNKRMSLDRMGLMALLNLTGAYMYAARVSLLFSVAFLERLNDCRYPKGGIHESTILWVVVTKYSTSWSSSPV